MDELEKAERWLGHTAREIRRKMELSPELDNDEGVMAVIQAVMLAQYRDRIRKHPQQANTEKKRLDKRLRGVTNNHGVVLQT